MTVKIGKLGRWGVVLGLASSLVGVAEILRADERPVRVVLAAQKTAKKKAAPARKGMTKAEDGMDQATKAAPNTKAAEPAPADGALSFKKDIAPILMANCVGCHSGAGRGLRNGKLDMSTFEKLMAGGKRGKDIVPGDPDSSHLVLMITGQETPKMPQTNGQMGFSEDAALKIQEWVKQGARLDAGLAATDPISKYASSLDDLRRAELAKLSPEERDKVAEKAGRDRWAKASKVVPDLTAGTHFLLLSKLPKARAEKLLKTMEAQFTQANHLLSTGRGPVLNPVEKIGLYVFNENNSFVEFVRTNENQEVEAGESGRAKLGVESPYLVAVNPAAGGEEATAAPVRKGARRKKAEDSPGGPERSLAGVLTEQLFVAAANQAGKPPRWLSLGLGAFMASHLEKSSPYYNRLRAETAENVRIGWVPKANEALGGQAKTETMRAVGFSLFEWISENAPMTTLAGFVRTMLDGQGKLDDAINNHLSLTREEFLNNSGLWLAEHYRRL